MDTRPFDLGILIEKKGIKFYTNALNKVYDENSKNLLNFLVREEKRHLGYFMALKFQAENNRALKISAKQEKFLFHKNALKSIKKSSATLFKIFETAIEMEEESIKLYTSLGKKFKDKTIRSFFKKIANYEKKHKKLIQTHSDMLYSYTTALGGIEQPGIES